MFFSMEFIVFLENNSLLSNGNIGIEDSLNVAICLIGFSICKWLHTNSLVLVRDVDYKI